MQPAWQPHPWRPLGFHLRHDLMSSTMTAFNSTSLTSTTQTLVNCRESFLQIYEEYCNKSRWKAAEVDQRLNGVGLPMCPCVPKNLSKFLWFNQFFIQYALNDIAYQILIFDMSVIWSRIYLFVRMLLNRIRQTFKPDPGVFSLHNPFNIVLQTVPVYIFIRSKPHIHPPVDLEHSELPT